MGVGVEAGLNGPSVASELGCSMLLEIAGTALLPEVAGTTPVDSGRSHVQEEVPVEPSHEVRVVVLAWPEVKGEGTKLGLAVVSGNVPVGSLVVSAPVCVHLSHSVVVNTEMAVVSEVENTVTVDCSFPVVVGLALPEDEWAVELALPLDVSIELDKDVTGESDVVKVWEVIAVELWFPLAEDEEKIGGEIVAPEGPEGSVLEEVASEETDSDDTEIDPVWGAKDDE